MVNGDHNLSYFSCRSQLPHPDGRGLLLSGICGLDATIGWLTFLCQRKEAFLYPFRATLHSLISAEGMRHVSLLLTENMPPKSMCSCEQSSLTVLLLNGVPCHFRRGLNIMMLHGSINKVRFHPLPRRRGLLAHK